MFESSSFLHPKSFPYQIKEKLGEGLNAYVYKAVKEHPLRGPSQIVALKILKSKTCVKKWRKEFQTLSSISSPYCVSVLGWEILNSKLSLVLEWVEGVTLRDLFLMKEMKEEEILFLCWQIQQGLIDLREAGSYHGDLSPLNVLINTYGQVKLIDFGLSYLEESFFTSSFQVTKEFAAPEILMGKKPDYFSDLYSLGKLMSFLVSSFSSEGEVQELSFLPPCLHFEAKKRQGLFFSKEKTLLKKDLALKVQNLIKKRKTLSVHTLPCSNPLLSMSFRRKQRTFHWTLKRFLGWKGFFSFFLAFFKNQEGGSRTHFSKLFFLGVFHSSLLFLMTSSSLFFDVSFHQRSVALSRRDLEIKSFFAKHLDSKKNFKGTTLIINTHHWFQVFINGKNQGYTPLLFENLRPGRLRIEGKRKEYRISKILEIKEGERVILNDSFFGLNPSFP